MSDSPTASSPHASSPPKSPSTTTSTHDRKTSANLDTPTSKTHSPSHSSSFPSLSSVHHQQQSNGTSTDPDLPLKLCLMILKSTAPEMRSRYNEYVKTKQRRNKAVKNSQLMTSSTSTGSNVMDDTPLTFEQFLYTSTIRNYGDRFVYEKTELAFYMMKSTSSSSSSSASSSSDDNYVKRDSFVRYTPILGIASKLDASKLYDSLSMVQHTANRTSDGISYTLFKSYVDSLDKVNRLEVNEWSDVRTSFPDLKPNEQLLCIRPNMLDSSSFPPALIRVGLTSTHFITESLILRRRKCAKWFDIKSIEKISASFLRSDSKFLIKYKDGTERILDAPGLGNELLLQRQRTFSYIAALITAHRLASEMADRDTIKPAAGTQVQQDDSVKQANARTAQIASAIVYEVSQTIKRMLALESVSYIPHSENSNNASSSTSSTSSSPPSGTNLALKPVYAEPLLLDMFPTEADQNKYVNSVTQLVLKSETLKKNKDQTSTWFWGSSASSSSSSGEKGSSSGGSSGHHKEAEDIDPEYAVDAQYDRMEHVSEVEIESFNVTKTTNHIKVLRQLVEPALLGLGVVKSLLNWDHVGVSGFTMAMLLNIAYQDACGYIPALIVLANIIFILVLKFNPELRFRLLQPRIDSTDMSMNSPKSNAIQSPPTSAVKNRNNKSMSDADNDDKTGAISASTDDNVNDTSSDTSDASADTGAGGGLIATYQRHKAGLLEKFKEYRSTALKGYAGLGSLQHFLQQLNFNILRFYGIYCWQADAPTQQFLAILVVIFLALWAIPFRYIFAGAVIEAFTLKWQGEGSALDRLLAQVPIPTETELFAKLE